MKKRKVRILITLDGVPKTMTDKEAIEEYEANYIMWADDSDRIPLYDEANDKEYKVKVTAKLLTHVGIGKEIK